MSAVAPEVAETTGWVFTGWNADFNRVESNMTVRALYERAPLTIADAVGCDLTWMTDGDAPWFAEWSNVAHDGLHHVRSGAVGNKHVSDLYVVVQGAGTVSFWCKASSEADGDYVCDGLSFYVDNINLTPDWIGGEIGWTNLVFDISEAGPHTLRWQYRKDKNDAAGADCVWLDEVTWTPAEVSVDMGGGKSVSVPTSWLAEHAALVAASGGDAGTALRSRAANGRMSVAECYVVGVDPEKADEDFKITSFPMKADGTPDLENIVFDPPEAKWNVEGARPVVKGAASLGVEWQAVTEENKAGFRFFKVEVVLP